MINEIFKEIFGDVDFEQMFKNLPEDEKKNENDHSYFHTIEDKYDNGKHVSHIEKEVKDGKVIKDINNTFKIEVKGEEEEKKEKPKENKCNSAYYEEKLKQATDLLEEAQNTIINQQKMIEEKTEQCKELETKLEKVFNLLK